MTRHTIHEHMSTSMTVVLEILNALSAMTVKIHAYISPTDIPVASHRSIQPHSRYIRKLKPPQYLSTHKNLRSLDEAHRYNTTICQHRTQRTRITRKVMCYVCEIVQWQIKVPHHVFVFVTNCLIAYHNTTPLHKQSLVKSLRMTRISCRNASDRHRSQWILIVIV